MRKLKSSTRSRILRAGLTAAALTASVLVTTAGPALAVVAPTLSRATGTVGDATTFTASGTGLIGASPTAPAVNFSTATSCPSASAANATNIAATTVVKNSADQVTITPPLTLVPTAYKVCIYTAATSGTLLSDSSGVYTVSAAAPVLNDATGITGGGNTITATAANFLTTVGSSATPAATFSIASCPATYTASPANLATAVTKSTAALATLTVPAGVVMPNAYHVCIYQGNTNGTSILLGVSSTTYTAVPPEVVLSSATGPTGGGNTITATVTGFLSGIASPGVTFSVASCPQNYTVNSTNFAATGISKLNDNSVSLTVPAGVATAAPAGTAYNACFYSGTVTSGTPSTLVGTSSTTYTALLPVVTLSITVGATATATPMTATSTVNFLTGVSPGATISAAACPSTYAPGAGNFAATGVQRVANNKAVLTVPTSVIAASPGPDYNVCIYDGSTTGASASTLIATSGTVTYSIVPVVAATTVSPSGGPAAGGTKITVGGSNLPTAPGSITATVGGYPMTVTAGTGSYFTAIVPAHVAAANLPIKVTTSSGTITASGTYSYSNGVSVAPNTGTQADTSILLDVTGVGFGDILFSNGASSTDTNGHVYLVAGVYDPTDNNGGTAGGDKTLGPIAECTGAQRISDAELICTLNLTGSLDLAGAAAASTPVPNGTYTVTVVDDGQMGPKLGVGGTNLTSQSIISSQSTFTVAPY